MEFRDLGPEGQTALERALGYLNFSSGAEDAQFLANLNLLYASLGSVAERAVSYAVSAPTISASGPSRL